MKLFFRLAIILPLIAFLSVVYVKRKHLYHLYAKLKHPFPIIMEADPQRGWRNKPGVHEAKYVRPEKTYLFPMRVGSEGQRLHPLSETTQNNHQGEIIGIGGSIAYGWGVNHHEPYLAQLATHYPNYHFVNLGVGGYGTYQSLLSLQSYSKDRPAPKAVIYGFGKHHEERNTASHAWKGMIYIHSQRGHVKVPYVRPNADGSLTRFAPEGYDTRPFFCEFALTFCGYYFEYKILPQLGKNVTKTEETQATRLLFRELKQWTARRNSRLIVVVMDPVSVKEYTAFFNTEKIEFLNQSRWHSLPFDSHPSVSYHQSVGKALAKKLANTLSKPVAQTL